jgi:hypothetical protein
MSNSSRIEAATRKHVGATLTNEQIVELVKVSDPSNTKGVYPSDVAYKRVDGVLVPRGASAYGDGILEYLGENSFKVLPTEQIVRRPTKAKVAAPKAETKPVAVAATPAAPKKAEKEKAVKAASKPPVAPKSKANDRHAAQ